MLRVMIGLIRGLGTLPSPWRWWVGLLVIVNFVVPWFFLDSPEAPVVLVAGAISAGIQMLIFRARGFVRLLGIAHLVTWTPMVLWLIARADLPAVPDAFSSWLVAVLVLDGISLVIDTGDVVRYVMGDRAPSLVLDDI